jgi:hypothetical protein
MIIILLLLLIFFALLFPGGVRTLLGLLVAFLCFAIANGLEPDGASRGNNQTEQVR